MAEDAFLLSVHHQDLERSFLRLVGQLAEQDRLESRAAWCLFERELHEHFALEEEGLIPSLRRQHTSEAAQVCREHREIRAALAELAVAADLNTVRADAVLAFLERLRAHAAREEELLYPWSETHVPKRRYELRGQQLGALSHSIEAAFGSALSGQGH